MTVRGSRQSGKIWCLKFYRNNRCFNSQLLPTVCGSFRTYINFGPSPSYENKIIHVPYILILNNLHQIADVHLLRGIGLGFHPTFKMKINKNFKTDLRVMWLFISYCDWLIYHEELV